MEKLLVEVSNNWTQIGGCATNQSIQINAADPDIFIRPNIEELVNGNKSILLSKEDSTDFCELCLEIYPQYKIQAVSFVCNVMRVEIFQGHIKEYLETVYGTNIDESDDDFKSYRYDIEVEKSGITHLSLRFLTNSNDVCIFGIMLYAAPNPNGITTLLPNSSCINIQNVENILENSSKLPERKSEKYKQLLDLMVKTKKSNTLSLEQFMGQTFNIVDKEQCSPLPKTTHEDNLNQLKLYIDKRITNMELRINRHLEDMEQRQMQKLNNILYLLEKGTKLQSCAPGV